MCRITEQVEPFFEEVANIVTPVLEIGTLPSKEGDMATFRITPREFGLGAFERDTPLEDLQDRVAQALLLEAFGGTGPKLYPGSKLIWRTRPEVQRGTDFVTGLNVHKVYCRAGWHLPIRQAWDRLNDGV